MIETNEASFTGTLWPVHLKPQEDELMSSWLARLALAHGQTASSFFNHVWPGRYLLVRDVINMTIKQSLSCWPGKLTLPPAGCFPPL